MLHLVGVLWFWFSKQYENSDLKIVLKSKNTYFEYL